MKHASMVIAVASCSAASARAPTRKPGSTVAIETSPGKATAVQVKETVATVESVDVKSRLVMLRDAAGREHAIIASPEVRNLEQLKKGDRVTVQYAESLSLKLVKNGKELPSRTDTTDGARAAGGRQAGRHRRRADQGHGERDRGEHREAHGHAERAEADGRSRRERSGSAGPDQGRRPDRRRVHAGGGGVRQAGSGRQVVRRRTAHAPRRARGCARRGAVTSRG